ncbi:MAG: peptide chain release factor-like protein [Planctomycetales bacterium]|nr:peptide chain release factor-like protein [Planctomycetales bacterium]
MHPSRLAEEELLKRCDVRSDRRSGPGGQHRNKVETAIVVTHRPSGITAEASERRSQVENRRVALFRLRLALALGLRMEVGPGPASPLWHSRVKNQRIAVSAMHEDYPSLLAELLDQLAAGDYCVVAAGDHFGVSPSQVVKLLRQYPPALRTVNEARAARGLHRLT